MGVRRLTLVTMACAITIAGRGQAGVPAAASAQPSIRAPQAATDPLGLRDALADGYRTYMRDVAEAVDLMPEQQLSFRPVADVRTFAETVAHIAVNSVAGCADVTGAALPDDIRDWKNARTRARLHEILRIESRICAALYTASSAEDLTRVVPFGPDRRVEAWYILIANLQHISHYYGTLATYLRLNGIVPPSTARMRR